MYRPMFAQHRQIKYPTRVALVLSAFCTFLWTDLAVADWLSQERDLMGTKVSVELWADDVEAGERDIVAVLEEFQRLDLMMNPWNPSSELSRINREAGRAVLSTTPEIVAVVSRSLHYSRLSGGVFDISFASVGQHYDYKTGARPDDGVLQEALPDIDYRAIHVDPKKQTIAFSKPGLQVDLGGIAKGYAVDRGIEMLQARGYEAAVVAAGGDSRILGDLGDQARTIGIRHPRKTKEFAVLMPLADVAISTSGDYERFFIEDGVRFHHILNPATGTSADGLQSASILTEKAIDSDALSTTVFVLGVEQGLKLVNSLPGVDAILIDAEGALHYSDDLLRLSQP
ncbi:MAG: FAD:protein FMN transferase [Halioglobus sp.]